MNTIKNLAILFFLLILIGCKKERKQEKVNIEKTPASAKTIVDDTIDSIKVFNVSYTKGELSNKTEKISKITKNLQPDFIEYPFTNDPDQLENTKLGYKSKSFLKTLARDFKNEKFLDAESIHYAYLLPNNKKTNYISIEEWYFQDSQKAKSCFESLKKYNEAEINFKTINWIWVYQENKIFLIFSTDYIVTDPEMQDIKQELIKKKRNTIALF